MLATLLVVLGWALIKWVARAGAVPRVPEPEKVRPGWEQDEPWVLWMGPDR